MTLIDNPFRGAPMPSLSDVPTPSTQAQAVAALLAQCPAHAPTPVVRADALGADTQGMGAQIWIKDERARMGLGSFKALGAAYVIAHDAVQAGFETPETALKGRTYVTASAGNHGLSVAAGARVFGAQAVVYLAETVPESFAQRLRAQGAQVVRAGAEYEASMAAAATAAQDNGWDLLSDSSWPGYIERPHRLMEGYLQMAAEALDALPHAPSHVLLQAGVGGLAGAVAALVRARCGDAPRIIVVEPAHAPALFGSIQAGQIVTSAGPVSAMGRLDCKEPSMIALAGLSRDADAFMLITEQQAADMLDPMARLDLAGSESGVAGVAGMRALIDTGHALAPGAGDTVLCFLSEGPA